MIIRSPAGPVQHISSCTEYFPGLSKRVECTLAPPYVGYAPAPLVYLLKTLSNLDSLFQVPSSSPFFTISVLFCLPAFLPLIPLSLLIFSTISNPFSRTPSLPLTHSLSPSLMHIASLLFLWLFKSTIMALHGVFFLAFLS